MPHQLNHMTAIAEILKWLNRPHADMEPMLDGVLDIILKLEWLEVEKKGAIFIADKEKKVLNLVSNKYLSPPLKKICKTVPFGRCLCGRAAETKKILYFSCVDERHENRFEGMPPHGHFNIPLLFQGEVLGVLVLYLKEGENPAESVFPFLESLSEILSAALIRKQGEKEKEALIQRLTESNQDLEAFAHVASHDLKAPLRAVENLITWLKEDSPKPLSEQNQSYFNQIFGRLSRMGNMLDDLLAYSKADQLTGNRDDQCDAFTIVENVKNLLDIPEGMQIIVSSSLEAIKVERKPFQQVCLNLIGNAIKHHPAPETGVVEVSVLPQASGALFSFKDNGGGIPAEFHEKIFNMFTTLKPRDQVEGSGMGLALVKKIITRLGGAISLESEENKGTTFFVFWPLEKKLDF